MSRQLAGLPGHADVGIGLVERDDVAAEAASAWQNDLNGEAMKESDLTRIEGALGISLPAAYRDVMLTRAEELKEVGQRHDFFAETVFVDPERLIGANQSEREPDMGTASAFPKWWQRFVLVGTDGGGNYYCLRLEEDERVWLIGSDCGARPKKKFDSFSDFIDSTIQSYENAESLPSSFDDSCPLVERFQITLSTDWDGQQGFCKIQAQEGDRPLTRDKLQSHGILAGELETCVRSIVASLANSSPESVQISDQADSSNFATYGEYVVGGFLKPVLADSRFTSATVEMFRGYMKVAFRLKDERSERIPAAKNLKVDWKRFHEGVVRLFEVLHPPGTRVGISSPKPESKDEEPRFDWSYEFDYTLNRR